MENILYNISQVLGITIIHSLWQGLVIYFMLRLALMFSAELSSSKKYMLATSSLVAITGWFIYTLINEIHIYNWLAVKPGNLSAMPLMLELPAGIHRLDDETIRYYYNIEGYLPYITALYAGGLLFNAARLILSRKKINVIRQTMSIDIALQYQVTKFSGMLKISNKVKVGLSKLVDVPCMVGYIKPVILLPFSLATYLSADEIEAILLHELAHIKRNDYLINLLLQVISILLFFNPCVQLINGIINEERENCCDDLVVNTTSNPLTYAKALLKLEQTRENTLQLAMSAIGKKYYLLNRIERIMKTKKPIGNIRHLALAILLLAGSAASIAWLNPRPAEAEKIIKPGLFHNLPIASNLANTISAVRVAGVKDSNKYILVSDTTKKYKHKSKVVAIDKHGSKRDYYSTDSLPPEWKAQMEVMKKEFNSPEWKEQIEAMKKQFNSPEWKAQMEAMKKQGEEMKKKFNSPEWKSQMLAMRKQGEEMKKQFDSPEWKAKMDAMKKQFDSPEWKNQMELMKKQGEEMKKQFDSPEWKAKMDAMKKQFNGPEWKKQMELMKKQGEEMRKQFDSPEWKEKMKDWQLDRKDSLKESRDTIGK